MALPNQPWTTSYPTSQDTVGVEQADLTADSAPGAADGHRVLVSHLHSIRDKLQAVATKLGDGSNAPVGSVGAKVATLEAGHAALHELGGAGVISVAGLSGLLATAQTPAAHAHTHAAATGQTVDDHHAKLHSADHGPAGADALRLDNLEVPEDNTDLNATIARHGLLPKLSNVVTEFLDGTGAFSTPAGGGGGGGLLPPVGSTVKYFVDGTGGNDVTGDGLVWGTAFATLDHVWNEVIPAAVRDRYVVEVRNAGAVSDANANGGIFANKIFMGPDGGVALVGEETYDVVASDTVGSSVTLWGFRPTTPPSAQDADFGKWVRFNDGLAINEVRQIRFNDTFGFSWTAPTIGLPAVGNAFDYVSPANAIEGNLEFHVIAEPGCYGLRISNLKHAPNVGADAIMVSGSPSDLRNVYQAQAIEVSGDGDTTFSGRAVGIDPTTGSDDAVASALCGPGVAGELFADGVSVLQLTGFTALNVRMRDCTVHGEVGGTTEAGGIANSVGVYQVLLENVVFHEDAEISQVSGSGYNAAAGSDMFRLHRSKVKFAPKTASASFYNGFQRHGIHAVDSEVFVDHAATSIGGVGDAGSGYAVKARLGSKVRVDVAATPTMTGTTGELATDSGPSTWAAVVGGTALVDPVESTVIRDDDLAADGWN